MSVLNFIAWLAVIVLALELLFLTLIIAVLCGGLFFGLRFVDKKGHTWLGKLNGWIDQGRSYERRGLRMVVKPVVFAYGVGVTVGETVTTLAEQGRKSG